MDDARTTDQAPAPRPRHALPKPDRITGRLFSAQKLPPEEVSRIEAHFTNKLGQNVSFRLIVDEDLIGGIRAEVGGIVWDGSVRGTLLSLREHLEA